MLKEVIIAFVTAFFLPKAYNEVATTRLQVGVLSSQRSFCVFYLRPPWMVPTWALARVPRPGRWVNATLNQSQRAERRVLNRLAETFPGLQRRLCSKTRSRSRSGSRSRSISRSRQAHVENQQEEHPENNEGATISALKKRIEKKVLIKRVKCCVVFVKAIEIDRGIHLGERQIVTAGVGGGGVLEGIR